MCLNFWKYVVRNPIFWDSLYVIENPAGKYYVGYSENIENRLIQHNTGVSKWTAGKGPWKIVWHSESLNRKDAFALEQKLKKQGRGNGFYRMTGLPRDGS